MNATATSLVVPSRARIWISIALVSMLLVSVFSTALGIRSASAQESQAQLASAVPADTVLYTSVNLDQSSDQWTLTYSLLERAGLNEFVESETGATTEDLGGMAEQANFSGTGAIVFTDPNSLASFSSAADLNGDYLAMADMEAEEISEEIPEGFAFILQPDSPEDLAAQFEQMAADEAEVQGVEVQTVEYNGVTISFWESDDPSIAGTATAVVDGTVVLATRASDIEPIIDAVQGNIDNLADTEGFANVTSRLPGDNLMLGYMNLDSLLTAMQADPSFIDVYGDIVSPEELEAGKAHAGFAMYASDSGFHFDSVVVPIDPSEIVSAGEFTPSMAERIPADVMLFSSANNLYSTGIADVMGGLFQGVMIDEGLDPQATPGPTPTIDETWVFFEENLGFNPDTDLLAKLDGEYAVYLGVYGLDMGFPSPEFLFVSETSDAATLQSTTATISMMVEMMNEGDYTVTTRDVEGGELTVVTLDAADTGGIPVVIEFGVVENEMLIGVNDAIDHYLDPSSDKLADDANFQHTMSLLPSENVVNVSYVNIEGQIMPLLDWFSTMLMGSMSSLDNHEDCGEYATQLEAQTAYDADPGTLWLLDLDSDGEACEDFFGESTPDASPESFSTMINIPAAGSVTWSDGEAVYTSSILVIGD